MAKKLLGKTDEQIQDIVGDLVVGQNDANVTYDDVSNQLAIDISTLTNEQVEDIVGSLLTAGNATNLTYDDSGNTLTVDVDESAISHDNISGVSASDHHTRYTDTEAQTAVEGNVDASTLSGSSGLSGEVLKSDGSNTLWGSVPRQIYGNGSDGSITHSSYTTVNVLECENYTLQSGTTIRPSNKNVIIHATDYIEINGEIDARGYGGNGGNSVGGGDSQDGKPGEPGNIGAPGEDGDGNGYGDAGGPGGPHIGPSSVNPYGVDTTTSSKVPSTPLTNVYENSTGGGGGGSGGYDYAGNSSGGGGDGGGIVVLCAPDVTVNGTIDVEGTDGGSWADRSGYGGPGGGGAVFIVAENFTNSGTYRLRGGDFNKYNDYGERGTPGSVRIIQV